MTISIPGSIIWAMFYLECIAARDLRKHSKQQESRIFKNILARVHEAMKDAGLNPGFDEDGNELEEQEK